MMRDPWEATILAYECTAPHSVLLGSWEIKFRDHIMFRDRVYNFNAGSEVLNIR